MKFNENNIVDITGEIASHFEFNHSIRGEKFYMFHINAMRKSGRIDVVPVLVSERIFDTTQNLKGLEVSISGEFRSHNQSDESGSHLKLFVFANNVEILDSEVEKLIPKNNVTLTGYICKPPVYRKTHLGKKITDVILSVSRKNRSDYIPCICWGINAVLAKNLVVGTKVKMDGRIQSRIFKKRIGENLMEERTAYEVSVNSLEVCEE